jgi:hypothetical protein
MLNLGVRTVPKFKSDDRVVTREHLFGQFLRSQILSFAVAYAESYLIPENLFQLIPSLREWESP